MKHGGNNIFIDDINIDINAGLQNISENIHLLEIFPNPAADDYSVKFTLTQTKTRFINVVNLLGEKIITTEKNVYYEGENNIVLKSFNLANGLYFIQLTDGISQVTKPLIIHHSSPY